MLNFFDPKPQQDDLKPYKFTKEELTSMLAHFYNLGSTAGDMPAFYITNNLEKINISKM